MVENQFTKSQEDAEAVTEPVVEQAAVLQRMIAELLRLRPDDRQKVLSTVATFFGMDFSPPLPSHRTAEPSAASVHRAPSFQFSEQPQAPTVKGFMFEKSPRTDVERVACLAYYLAHYRGTPHVKTKDITAINTESAHRKFSNTAVAVDNATKAGYLVSSVKGAKQISALGERFVEALPDREAARSVFEQSRQRRSSSGAGKKS